jgi:hypothetical protein
VEQDEPSEGGGGAKEAAAGKARARHAEAPGFGGRRGR